MRISTILVALAVQVCGTIASAASAESAALEAALRRAPQFRSHDPASLRVEPFWKIKGQTSGKPPAVVIEVKFTTLIPAGTVWDSAVRFGEQCGFDLHVAFDQTFVITSFADHDFFRIVIKDTYTNVATGFSFVDQATYTIRFDYATLEALHNGVFWFSNVAGSGVEVLDSGSFKQIWNGPFPWPIFDLKGSRHDVNGVPFGTRSYGNWAQGVFP